MIGRWVCESGFLGGKFDFMRDSGGIQANRKICSKTYGMRLGLLKYSEFV